MHFPFKIADRKKNNDYRIENENVFKLLLQYIYFDEV